MPKLKPKTTVAPLWRLLGAAALALVGCARERPAAGYPQAASDGWVVPASHDGTAESAARPSEQAAHAASDAKGELGAREPKRAPLAPTSIFAKTLGDVPRPRARNELRSVLPGSAECLLRLSERGVRFHSLDRELGVKTPVVVDGPIAGVRYYTGASGALVADCRLVLALSIVGPELRAFGVTDARFSGAYVYRLSNKGRVSLHAYGLAIDLHGFTRLGVHYEVEHDFRKGLPSELPDDAPVANAVAARFRDSGLFHEYLTPDDNADHHDHVHLGVSPLPDEVL